MKFETTKHLDSDKTIYTLEITGVDILKAEYSKLDRYQMEYFFKQSSIEAILMGLQVMVRGIESKLTDSAQSITDTEGEK